MSVAKEENRDLLFDLEADPKQLSPLQDRETEQRMLRLMAELMLENDAPEEQYARIGIQKPAH